MADPIIARIAAELGVRDAQVGAAVALLDGGATVPFVARYRKEATGSLDDAQLRRLEERLGTWRDLEERRAAVLKSVRQQGLLDPKLEAAILSADSRARLEDIYLPFRPKRRTKAEIAREAGLGPLADTLLARPDAAPEALAGRFADRAKGVADADVALEGARAILAERFGEDADLVGGLREAVWTRGRMVAKVKKGQAEPGVKFADYFDFAEAPAKLPSHRILALFRGERDGVLDLDLTAEAEAAGHKGPSAPERGIMSRFGLSDRGRPGDAWMAETVRAAWRTKILPRLDTDLRTRLRETAETEAARVFAANLRDLLLAAPAGARATLGLDPGFRSGTKAAVVDRTGKVLATATVHPHEPQRRWDEALAVLGRLAVQHRVELVAIGNGTASRETDRLAAELLRQNPALGMTKVVVSEAGASVYSASATASEELPGLDVTLRGAVSIARRLQDPLAELVKIDPKSIGVGQYQHDIDEARLSRSLDGVVEDCVNAVGVEVNMASAPLLARVAGVGPVLAGNIVAHRDAHGPFPSRKALMKVARMGPKAFEQCAGFLRIAGGEDPLDASGVHPEAYPVVRRILAAAKTDARGLIGNAAVLRELQPARFADASFGLPTVTDILRELEKPGRDPRPAFQAVTFKDGVEAIGDLEPGMVLEGAVTNVAAFGAFVDIGVHQDGLVHVSAMSRSFVKDPREVVKPGDVVRVKVLEVDKARKRIALTLRLDDEPGAAQPRRGVAPTAPPPATSRSARSGPASETPAKPAEGALGEALRRAGAPPPRAGRLTAKRHT